MEYYPTCILCSLELTWQFYICHDCEEDYGQYEEWAPWLQDAVRDEASRRMRIQRDAFLEILFDEELHSLGYDPEAACDACLYDPEEQDRVIDWNKPGYYWRIPARLV